MKKFISIILLSAMVLSLNIYAFASEEKAQKPKVSAVAIVKEGPGLPLVADSYSLRMTRDANGASCDKELGDIPSSDVVYYTADQLELMPEESRKLFEAQIEAVKQMDPELVKYLFWIELTGDSAGKVGEQKDGSKVELDMWFSDYEGEDLYALENSHEADLNDSIRNGNYRLTLKETGAVVITTVGVQVVEGVMEVVTEEVKEGKKIWVNSPIGHWEEDPDEPETRTRHSQFVPVFGKREYEIKLLVAKEAEAEEDELIVNVPTEDLYVMTLDQMDVLTEEAQEQFVREYERIRDDKDHVVQYFFYIDLSDEYRELVGEQEDGSMQYLLLSFTGDRDDYIVTSNGNAMDVDRDETEEGTYLVKLTELGALAIMYPDGETSKAG